MIVLGVIGGLFRAALLGALTFSVALAVAGVLMLTGGPEVASDCNGRAITRSGQLSDQFQTRWDQLDDGGEEASFDESEVSSRASTFFDTERLKEIGVCFELGSGTGSAAVDIPGVSAISGDVRVRASGTVDLSGPAPVVSVSNVEIGSLPSFIANRIATQPLEDALNAELASATPRQRYTVEIQEGTVHIVRLGPPVFSN